MTTKFKISMGFIASLGILATVSLSNASAQSSSSLTGKYYQDGHLAITNTFNSTPSTRCRVDLYARLSNIKVSGGEITNGTSRIIGRIPRTGSRRVRFTSSTLPRLQKTQSGTSDDAYPQINLQTKSRCSGQTITSNVVAIPLKCGDTTVRTATSGRFISLLDSQLGGD